ncbi:MAG: hypothetical protein M0Z99_25085 [Betaproteobacteria bacterium]|nr:hypothetical protein [Betaproteobacteria bacterium]
MSKPAAITDPRCRKQIFRICAALSVLTLLPVADAVAAESATVLRRAEQLDLRRLGKISEDERSVLRIEWRVGLSGVEEARSVQDMLDNLRRIEQTMVALSQLVRNIPAQQPVPSVAAVAAEPAASGDHGTRLMIANIAAACLVVLWWFRRRKSAEPAAARAIGAPQESPFAAAPPLAAEPPPLPPLASASDFGRAAPVAPAATSEEITPRIEAQLPTETITTVAAPTPIVPPDIGPDPAPASAASAAAAPPPEAPAPIIDFSLEHDPQGEARAKARIPVVRRKDDTTHVPEQRQAIDVEPTLQLAEIMLSMGLEQGAAQALVEYTEANPRHALHHWLKLLGIYRKRGLHKEFTEAAEKLRQNFNIQAEDWAKQGSGEAPSLEKFSRVAEHVQKIWVQPAECIAYLRHLLEDNRDGERAGFPQAVAEEMLLLIEILKQTSGVDQSATG